MTLKFQWDEANSRHVLTEYPERLNTIEEIESVFRDEYLLVAPDRFSLRGEQEYSGVGISNQNVICFVAFTIRNGEIRVFSCRHASKKERQRYEEEKQTGAIGR